MVERGVGASRRGIDCEAERAQQTARAGLVGPRRLGAAASPAAPRLAAYWQARQRYLQAGHGIGTVPGNLHDLLAQVREPLLAVLRISPDFRPARDPLQRMSLALEPSDPVAARALLEALARVDAARVEYSGPQHTGLLEHP